MRGFDDDKGGYRRDGQTPPAGPGRGTGWPGLGGGAARPPEIGRAHV